MLWLQGLYGPKPSVLARADRSRLRREPDRPTRLRTVLEPPYNPSVPCGWRGFSYPHRVSQTIIPNHKVCLPTEVLKNTIFFSELSFFKPFFLFQTMF